MPRDDAWAERLYGRPLVDVGTQELLREYSGLSGALFGLFGHNAAVSRNAIGRELLRRGVTAVPNIFGDIPITTNHRALGLTESERAQARAEIRDREEDERGDRDDRDLRPLRG
jgi:hypothetical protein